VLPVWLTLVLLEVAGLDVAGLDVAGLDVAGLDVAGLDVAGLVLVDVDGDVVAFGWAACVRVAVGLSQGVAVASAVFLPVALAFAVAEADADAEAVVVAVLVPVALAVGVLVVLALPVGLALLAVLALVLLLAGLVAEAAGLAPGLVDLLALFNGDGDELDGHAVAFVLVRLLGILLGLAPPADELIAVADPSVPWGPLLLLLLLAVNPTAEPICPKAWRSGGTARTTPMANTAQAAARPDRSSPSRQSRGWRRA
jgi:hypothetical protein